MLHWSVQFLRGISHVPLSLQQICGAIECMAAWIKTLCVRRSCSPVVVVLEMVLIFFFLAASQLRKERKIKLEVALNCALFCGTLQGLYISARKLDKPRFSSPLRKKNSTVGTPTASIPSRAPYESLFTHPQSRTSPPHEKLALHPIWRMPQVEKMLLHLTVVSVQLM